MSEHTFLQRLKHSLFVADNPTESKAKRKGLSFDYLMFDYSSAPLKVQFTEEQVQKFADDLLSDISSLEEQGYNTWGISPAKKKPVWSTGTAQPYPPFGKKRYNGWNVDQYRIELSIYCDFCAFSYHYKYPSMQELLNSTKAMPTHEPLGLVEWDANVAPTPCEGSFVDLETVAFQKAECKCGAPVSFMCHPSGKMFIAPHLIYKSNSSKVCTQGLKTAEDT